MDSFCGLFKAFWRSFGGHFGTILSQFDIILGRFGFRFEIISGLISLHLGNIFWALLLFFPKPCSSGVRLDTFHIASVLFLFPLSGRWKRGHLGSKCKEGTSPRRYVPWRFFFCACYSVLPFLSGRLVVRGTWLEVLSWGN